MDFTGVSVARFHPGLVFFVQRTGSIIDATGFSGLFKLLEPHKFV